MTWQEQLAVQLEWHWTTHVRPRLEDLTDVEYWWEPVAGCWSIRRRGHVTTASASGGGEFVLEWESPEPEPSPVTTIAWRLGHLVVDVFGTRTATYFGGPPVDHRTWEYARNAREALEQLDEAVDRWIRGVQASADDALGMPVGRQEGSWTSAGSDVASLVLHVNREAIHHASEILLLRDLHRHHLLR